MIKKIRVEELFTTVSEIAKNQGNLLSLWGSERDGKFNLHLAFIYLNATIDILQCQLSKEDPTYPDLSSLFPVADRCQRALYDLFGFIAENAEDNRPWLRHHSWPEDFFPLRETAKLSDHFPPEKDHYPFIRVGGEGVHEIPVGPVHAGIIEPGHFRFSVAGERILKLETRLGYTHKGIAKHLQHASFQQGATLSGRISGDSTVAYAWAYSMALEKLHHITISPRAEMIRAVLLELERIANHCGDLGALGNDAGWSFAWNQFSRLKENLLRMNEKIFGHRYLKDLIVPGGVTCDVASNNIYREIEALQREIAELRNLFAEHEGLQDRFVATGIITQDLATKLGLLGLTARASGVPLDCRIQMPVYQGLKVCTEKNGDVAARVALRFREIDESCRVICELMSNIPQGELQISLPQIDTLETGTACIEGFRGPIFVALANENQQSLQYAHFHDSSWQNWPALEHAVIGNIVPDFPLINKSLNLSYSGHDG